MGERDTAASGRATAQSAVVGRLRNIYSGLTSSERKIADNLLAHSSGGGIFSISDLAIQAGVSEATLVRFSKKLGYSGFLEFKKAFFFERLQSTVRSPSAYQEITLDDDSAEVLNKVFSLIQESLTRSLHHVDAAAFATAVAWMAQARVIEFYAHGGSAYIAQNAVITCQRLGIRCAALDALVLAAAVENTSSDDVVVGISYTGVTEGVVRAVARARERGIRTCAITNTPGSPLAAAAEIVLITAVSSPILVSDAGVSRVAQVALLDALAAAVVQYRRRRAESRPNRGTAT